MATFYRASSRQTVVHNWQSLSANVVHQAKDHSVVRLHLHSLSASGKCFILASFILPFTESLSGARLVDWARRELDVP